MKIPIIHDGSWTMVQQERLEQVQRGDRKYEGQERYYDFSDPVPERRKIVPAEHVVDVRYECRIDEQYLLFQYPYPKEGQHELKNDDRPDERRGSNDDPDKTAPHQIGKDADLAYREVDEENDECYVERVCVVVQLSRDFTIDHIDAVVRHPGDDKIGEAIKDEEKGEKHENCYDVPSENLSLRYLEISDEKEKAVHTWYSAPIPVSGNERQSVRVADSRKKQVIDRDPYRGKHDEKKEKEPGFVEVLPKQECREDQSENERKKAQEEVGIHGRAVKTLC